MGAQAMQGDELFLANGLPMGCGTACTIAMIVDERLSIGYIAET